ncbi:hypothetical protein LCGC14_0788730 [marine sediment metagenome]|uniref:Uncharacterized protein n=1 Tax=marine sediment metagenome TaxID=412755 RepID=A0A0F9QD27_9ZZZZ
MKKLKINEASLQDRYITGMMAGLLVALAYRTCPKETKEVLDNCRVDYMEEEEVE